MPSRSEVQRRLRADPVHGSRWLGGLSDDSSRTSAIDPTDDEIDFIRRLTSSRGEIRLRGKIKLLRIDRLIPKYVSYVGASTNTGVFTLTHQGWQLARLIGCRYPLPGGAPF